jgi:predicted tellurium resistance membrane protein TerC
MEAFLTADVIMSFLTLSVLEVVLGIDNLIFIALVVQNLPAHFRHKARYIGLTLALGMRVAMLLGIAWIMSLTKPVLTVSTLALSVKDLLLFAGGIFLLVKSTLEIHSDVAGMHGERAAPSASQYFAGAIAQIVLIDLVFSFDSVITAVGMTNNIPVIIAAMIVAMIAMLGASGYIADFLQHHPTFKMLALSFILMIGVLLIAEAMHFHVPRGYVYFAFAFSIFVESMNTFAASKRRGKDDGKGGGI